MMVGSMIVKQLFLHFGVGVFHFDGDGSEMIVVVIPNVSVSLSLDVDHVVALNEPVLNHTWGTSLLSAHEIYWFYIAIYNACFPL